MTTYFMTAALLFSLKRPSGYISLCTQSLLSSLARGDESNILTWILGSVRIEWAGRLWGSHRQSTCDVVLLPTASDRMSFSIALLSVLPYIFTVITKHTFITTTDNRNNPLHLPILLKEYKLTISTKGRMQNTNLIYLWGDTEEIRMNITINESCFNQGVTNKRFFQIIDFFTNGIVCLNMSMMECMRQIRDTVSMNGSACVRQNVADCTPNNSDHFSMKFTLMKLAQVSVYTPQCIDPYMKDVPTYSIKVRIFLPTHLIFPVTPSTIIISPTQSMAHGTMLVGRATYPMPTMSRQRVSLFVSHRQYPMMRVLHSKLLMSVLLMVARQYQLNTTKALSMKEGESMSLIKQQSVVRASSACMRNGPMCVRWQPSERRAGQRGLRIGSAIVHSHVRMPLLVCRSQDTQGPCQYSSGQSQLVLTNRRERRIRISSRQMDLIIVLLSLYSIHILYILSTRHIYSSNSEKSDSSQSIRNVLDPNPPNQIISDAYTSDMIPIVRPACETRLNVITSIAPRAVPPSIKHYTQYPAPSGTLRHHYSHYAEHFIYLKFDNTPYSAIHNQRPVMGALYMPLQSIIDAAAVVPFYKQCGVDQYISSRSSIKFGLGYGCVFDPKFSSNYQGGNLFMVVRVQPYRYDLIIQSDTNADSQINYFNFAVKFIEEGDYTFTIANMTTQMSARVLYKRLYDDDTSTPWAPIPQSTQTTKSPFTRENYTDRPYYRVSFSFRCKNKNESYIFSSKYPYDRVDEELFLHRIIEKKLRLMTMFQHTKIGQSILGHPIYSYEIRRRRRDGGKCRTYNIRRSQLNQLIRSDPPMTTTTDSMGQERSIVILARQQAAATEGAYMQEGMMEHLLDALESDPLKKVLRFYFIPCVNPDGVMYGHSVGNMVGEDVGEHWETPHPHYHPEVWCVKKHIQHIEQVASVLAIINITHSAKEEKCSIQGKRDRVFPFFCGKRSQTIRYNGVMGEGGVYCMEDVIGGSVYEVQMGGGRINEEGLRGAGREVVSLFMEYVKLMEKNSVMKGKWSKEMEAINLNSIAQKKPSIKSIEERLGKQFLKVQRGVDHYVRSRNRHQTYKRPKNELKSIDNTNYKNQKKKKEEQKEKNKISQKQNSQKEQSKENKQESNELNLANLHLRFTIRKRVSKVYQKKSFVLGSLLDKA